MGYYESECVPFFLLNVALENFAELLKVLNDIHKRCLQREIADINLASILAVVFSVLQSTC